MKRRSHLKERDRIERGYLHRGHSMCKGPEAWEELPMELKSSGARGQGIESGEASRAVDPQ